MFPRPFSEQSSEVLVGMKVCLLIGFSYGEDSDINYVDPDRSPLPGIIVDLYQAYIMSKNMKPDRIIVATDIVRDQQTSVLLNSMLDSTVDTGVLSFIETIQSKDRYRRFTGKNDFVDTMKVCLQDADEAFIYYTGHVSDGYFLFPMDGIDVDLEENIENVDKSGMIQNLETYTYTVLKQPGVLRAYHEAHQYTPNEDKTKLSLTEYKEIIINSVKDKCKLFIVMDCCNSNGLDLPFQMKDGIYRLTPNDVHTFVSQEIICISSTMLDEHSIASRDGSIFTRSLFFNLRQHHVSLHNLISIVGVECSSRFSQTTTIHSSHPNLKYFWPWIYGLNRILITINHFNNTIIVDRIPYKRKISRTYVPNKGKSSFPSLSSLSIPSSTSQPTSQTSLSIPSSIPSSTSQTSLSIPSSTSQPTSQTSLSIPSSTSQPISQPASINKLNRKSLFTSSGNPYVSEISTNLRSVKTESNPTYTDVTMISPIGKDEDICVINGHG